MRILLVDDDPDIRDQLVRLLAGQKYIVEVATDGEKALDRIYDQPFDLIVLDIMMPVKDGLSVLQEIRQAKIGTPVLMLSAKSEINDKIKGLDQGADDYLAKPFSASELLARMRALLRRGSEHAAPTLNIKDILLNTVTREVTARGNIVPLTPKEFAILEFLFYNKNRTISRFSLAEHVWGEDFDPFTMSNYIDVHIKNLRRKIGDTDGSIVRTIRGVGYIVAGEG
ncbi:MAG: response regulator transcription factor [Desulfurivibrionaceae bacterium]